jgi:L-2-hydroxyglutarate oxidase LhgO
MTRLGVIGGGIIGLAVARQFLLDHPGAEVEVLEKELDVARHQTGRNSGVVHAGIYYAPGSAKATLCRRGASMLQEFCAERGIAYEACGKLVVARDASELDRLEALVERATAAGVPGLTKVGPEGIKELEPHAVGVAAIHSPTTAIVDYVDVARAMAADIVSAGGRVHCGAEVTSIEETASAVVVETADGSSHFDELVICAGLQADRVARLTGGPADPRIIPFRGEYYTLKASATSLARGLIYPVPDPRYPFLGVHFTKRIDGSVDVGPNAVLALAREGYRWRDVRLRDLGEIASWPGSWHMAWTHWRTGGYEIAGSLSKAVYAHRARSYVPELKTEDLMPRPSGVRAQAVDRDGNLIDDFVVQRSGRVVAVRNAPSPAATSSLAIAERICRDELTSGS